MSEWWNGLSMFQQVLFIIAVATTVFMIIQIIMMAVSAGDDPTFDASTDADMTEDTINESSGSFTIFGLKVLTVRSIIAFFAIGSWVTFSFEFIIPWYFSLIIGIVAGAAAAFAIAYFMKAVEKLQTSGNVTNLNAIGKNGEVYLTIPAKRASTGKVNVFFQERFIELEAVTDSVTPILTGAKVKIIDRIDEGTVIVEALKFDNADIETKRDEKN